MCGHTAELKGVDKGHARSYLGRANFSSHALPFFVALA